MREILSAGRDFFLLAVILSTFAPSETELANRTAWTAAMNLFVEFEFPECDFLGKTS